MHCLLRLPPCPPLLHAPGVLHHPRCRIFCLPAQLSTCHCRYHCCCCPCRCREFRKWIPTVNAIVYVGDAQSREVGAGSVA